MIKIHKDNQDFIFQIEIETTDHDTHETVINRVHDFHEFIIKVYTNDIDDYIEASYQGIGTGIYQNIVEQDDHDFLIIQSQDLATLEDGILKFHVEYAISSTYFDDGYYNECYDIETGFMLVSKRYDNSECPICLIED